MTAPSHTKNVLPSASATFLEDLRAYLRLEDADRYLDMFANFVVSGGTHGAGAGLTKTPDTLGAYVQGRLVRETGSITYPDAQTTWVVAHIDTTGNIGTFTRVTGTHYLTRSQVAQPALPNDSTWLMKVVTSGGAVTTVTDLRTRNPIVTALQAISNMFFAKLLLAEAAAGSFNWAYNDFTNAFSSRLNHVIRWGYNIGPGGGIEKAGEPAVAWEIESFFTPDTSNNDFEVHLAHVLSNGTVLRPWSIRFSRDASTLAEMGFSMSKISFFGANGTNQWMVLQPNNILLNGSTSVQHNQNNTNFLQQLNQAGNAFIEIARVNAADEVQMTSTAVVRVSSLMTDGNYRETFINPPQLTADQNNYNPTGSAAGVWQLTSDISRTITGIAAAGDGRRLTLRNNGGQNVVLGNNSGSSSAGNRIITGTGANITMAPEDVVELIREPAANWVVVNHHT